MKIKSQNKKLIVKFPPETASLFAELKAARKRLLQSTTMTAIAIDGLKLLHKKVVR